MGNPAETSMEEFQKTWQGDLYAYLTDPDWLDPCPPHNRLATAAGIHRPARVQPEPV